MVKSFKVIQILLMGALLAAPNQVQAWSKYGHLTICDLAYRNLTPTSRQELTRLFNKDGGGIKVPKKGNTKARKYTSFNLGCLEEDERPRKNPSDHFLNVPRNLTKIDSDSCYRKSSCILAGIERDLKILKDESNSNEDRVFALMAIGHWVGDIHQPLHVSFADDLGGNQIKVKLRGKCGTHRYRYKPSKLHAVWDDCLLQAGLFEKVRQSPGFKKSWGKRTITYRAVDYLVQTTSLEEEKKIVSGTPIDWANQSLKVTLKPTTLYCVKVGENCQYSVTQNTLKRGDKKRKQIITQDYINDHKLIAEKRVRQAGFRLANIINLALDENYTGPT